MKKREKFNFKQYMGRVWHDMKVHKTSYLLYPVFYLYGSACFDVDRPELYILQHSGAP